MFGISYDPVETLRTFAETHRISYPLLSDTDSLAIRQLGLLNRHIAEQQAFYGKPVAERHRGLPYPGSFVLDERGIVVHKKFEQSYRVRPSAPALLEDMVGALISTPDAPAAQDVGLAGVQALAWTHSHTYRPLEKVRVHLCVEMPEDIHVYGPRSAGPFIPLNVRIASWDGSEVTGPGLPEEGELDLQSLGETAYVYTGRICTHFDVTTPDSHQPVDIEVLVDYQACTDTVCHPPYQLRMPFHLLPCPQVN